jgi:ketosteroid isomerase-like protein
MNTFRLACALFLVAAPLAAHEAPPAPPSILPASARSAAATVDSFHAALRRGDTRAAASLLTDDALVFEAGGAERSKAEYAAQHLAADAEFSRSTTATVTRRSGGSDGRLAWIASEGRTTGSFRGRSIDSTTAETMLLRRLGRAWKIAHIHWSSAAVQPKVAAFGEPLLRGSTPANGAVVTGPVNSLELVFSPRARLLEVVVAGPGGVMPMMVTATGENARYSLPVAALGPGAYSIDWRATAAGREDRGTFSFTVK